MGGPETFDSSYPIQLEKLLARRLSSSGHRVVNLGRAGSNTAQMLRNLRRGIAEHRPDVVLVLAGWNNYRNFQGFRRPGQERGRAQALRDSILGLRVYKLAQMLVERVRGETTRHPGDDEDSGQAFARVASLRRMTSDSLGHLERGMAFKQRGEIDAAIACFVEAIEANPTDPRAYRQIAKSLRTGAGAEYYFARAVEDHPDRVWPMLGLSILYQDQGRHDEADRWLERATGKEPELDGYLRQIRQLLDRDRAREQIDRWIELDLAEMHRLCSSSGAALVIQTYPHGDFEVLARVAARHRLPLVDHKPAFDRIPASERDSYYLLGDFHPNTRGNAVMAETILRVLLEEGLVVTSGEGNGA
jgi:tetratricopeptide (TPR) repeat protein